MALKPVILELNAVGMASIMGMEIDFFCYCCFVFMCFCFSDSFVLFTNYRIPRENLLNKHGDVLPDGTYKTQFKV